MEYMVNVEDESHLMYGDKYERLIRCEKCKYADFDCPCPVCNFLEMNITEDGFCKWAKMKGDDSK